MSCVAQLPTWLVYLNAAAPFLTFLGALSIGIGAGLIAYGQLRISKAKLKLDLYDRRIAVYEATKRFVLGLSSLGTVDAENLQEYLVATRQAEFLFDDDSIPSYLRLLGTEARRLNYANSSRDESTVDPIAKQSAIATYLELCKWFLDQETVIKAKFSKYLQLGE